MELSTLPPEILDHVIERLVVKIGITKAVRLRIVNRAFNAAILFAICDSQVVDIHDPATDGLEYRMDPALRGKIFAVKSRSADDSSKSYVQVVAKVNEGLDRLIGPDLEENVTHRHESIASAVEISRGQHSEPFDEARNLLCGAAVVGDLSVFKRVLEINTSRIGPIDINCETWYFDRPLTLAAARGHYEVVRYLLLQDPRMDSIISTWESTRFVELADWNNQVDDICQSMALSASPASALRAAVVSGHGDIVHLLLREEHRLPVNSPEYLRAIIAGARAGRPDLISTLFRTIGKELSDFEGFGVEMLWEAIRGNQIEVVQLLLDEGVDVNDPRFIRHRPYSGGLKVAAAHGNMSMVQLLIARGADVHLNPNNGLDHSPVDSAARCGQEEIVDLLIDHGADPIAAFHTAAREAQPHLLRRLLSRFPDLPFRDYPGPNEGLVGSYALCYAIFCGNLTTMTILVQAGVDVNDGCPIGEDSFLNMAKRCRCGSWVVNHLLSLGALENDVEIVPDHGDLTIDSIKLSERTWEWMGKY